MLQKNNTIMIMREFFDFPSRRFSLRELARISGKSTTPVKKILNELEKEGVVKKVSEGPYSFYQANRESSKYRTIKRLFSIYILHSCGLLDCLEINYRHPEAIVLFGSYSRGEDNEKSDIDIFIMSECGPETSLEKFEKILRRKISINHMTRNKFQSARKKNPQFVNNLANGTVLYGYIEVL